LFTDFYYLLRKRKVPVSITEWMTLMEALSQGLVTNLDEFYYLARAVLVKSETYFDQYDVAFQEFFTGMEFPSDISKQILEWLKDPINRTELTEEERALLDMMDFDKLLKEFEKRMAEQTEQHDGGNYWIGRGGTSPFGHSGKHPAGIRVGGESRGRGAIQIAHPRPPPPPPPPPHPDRLGAEVPQLPRRHHPGRAPDQDGAPALEAPQPHRTRG
jgi:uncharacterized protein with von Willebrand factor type A (vWA) domain